MDNYSLQLVQFVGVAGLSVAGAAYLYVGSRDPDEIGGRAFRSAWGSILIFLINLALFPFYLIAFDLTAAAYDALHIPTISPETWAGVPTVVMIPLGIIVVDFVTYWAHRFMHTKWIFPMHAIHHSPTHLNGFSTYRIHIIEMWMVAAGYIFMLSWLALPVFESAAIVLLPALHNAYVHINLAWSHGRFEWLVASPRFHRWHHADVPQAYGKNLANIMPLWDHLFGTYYNPGPCHEHIGIGLAPETEDDALKLTLYPFAAWARMVRDVWVRDRDCSADTATLQSAGSVASRSDTAS